MAINQMVLNPPTYTKENTEVVKAEELPANVYYFLVNTLGQYMKTKFKKDFDNVKEWGGVIFADEVKNSKRVYFKVGNKTLQKRINQLKISEPQYKTWWFDINELELNGGNRISKIWIGGKDETEEIETIPITTPTV